MARRKRYKSLFFTRDGKVRLVRHHPDFDPLKAGEIPKHLRPKVLRILRAEQARERRRRRSRRRRR